jgi:hypothetical protein
VLCLRVDEQSSEREGSLRALGGTWHVAEHEHARDPWIDASPPVICRLPFGEIHSNERLATTRFRQQQHFSTIYACSLILIYIGTVTVQYSPGRLTLIDSHSGNIFLSCSAHRCWTHPEMTQNRARRNLVLGSVSGTHLTAPRATKCWMQEVKKKNRP